MCIPAVFENHSKSLESHRSIASTHTACRVYAYQLNGLSVWVKVANFQLCVRFIQDENSICLFRSQSVAYKKRKWIKKSPEKMFGKIQLCCVQNKYQIPEWINEIFKRDRKKSDAKQIRWQYGVANVLMGRKKKNKKNLTTEKKTKPVRCSANLE